MHRSCILLLVLSIARLLSGQSAATASVSGRVVSETGTPLRAVISAEPSGRGAAVRLVTALDGSFTFPALSAGQWSLCTAVPAEQSAKPGQPFLSGCVWGSPEAVVQVVAGKSVSGLQLIAKTGVVQQIQINDPQAILAAAAPGGLGLDKQLQLFFRASDRIPRLPVLTSQSAQGRTYSLTIPPNTPLTLQATLQQGKVVNSAGSQVVAEIPVQAAAGTQPAPISLTVAH